MRSPKKQTRYLACHYKIVMIDVTPVALQDAMLPIRHAGKSCEPPTQKYLILSPQRNHHDERYRGRTKQLQFLEPS